MRAFPSVTGNNGFTLLIVAPEPFVETAARHALRGGRRKTQCTPLTTLVVWFVVATQWTAPSCVRRIKSNRRLPPFLSSLGPECNTVVQIVIVVSAPTVLPVVRTARADGISGVAGMIFNVRPAGKLVRKSSASNLGIYETSQEFRKCREWQRAHGSWRSRIFNHLSQPARIMDIPQTYAACRSAGRAHDLPVGPGPC